MIQKILSVLIFVCISLSTLSDGSLLRIQKVQANEPLPWEIKKIAVSEHNIYVLNQVKKTIIKYDTTFQKIKEFDILTPFSYAQPEPMDIFYSNNTIYIADKGLKKILFFSTDGKMIKTLGGFENHFIAPTALLVKDNHFVVADTNSIWLMDELGNIRRRISLLPYTNELPSLVTDMCYADGVLYAACETNQTVLAFRDEGDWSDFQYYKSFGGLGYETGRFIGLSGIAVDGTLFASDLYRSRIQAFPPLVETASTLPIPPGVSPSDMIFWKDKLLYVNTESNKINSISYQNETERNVLLTSTNQIDFGTYIAPINVEKHFSIYQKNGFPLHGKVLSDNPAFIINPKELNGTTTYMTISLNTTLLKTNSLETGTISIELANGEKKTIETKIKISKSADFEITLRSNNDISFQNNSLSINISPQNGFKGTLEFSSKSNDLPFMLQWDQTTITIDKEDRQTVKAMLLPKSKLLPGFYTVPYQIKAKEQKSIKQGTITFLYKGIEDTVPGTLIGELFSTDWCPFCPSAHRAVPELEKMYNSDLLNFITYYIDCSNASPQRLCFPEGTLRKDWYMPSGTPTLILNGTAVKNGGYKSPTETMTKDYKEMIDIILPNASPVSLTGFATIDSVNRSISIGAAIEWLQKIKIEDPRLYCVIAENKIEYPAKNKVNIHDNVIRQFISLPNPENSPAYGTPLIDQTQYHLNANLNSILNLENCYCMLFIQDNATKQVFQSRRIPLTEQIKINDFNLTSIQKDFIARQEKNLSVSYTLQNLGNQIQEYSLEILEKSTLPLDSVLKVNGNEFSPLSTVLVSMNPFESVEIEIQTYHPPDPSKLNSLTLKATDLSNELNRYQSIPIRYVKDDSLRYELLYPIKDPKTTINDFKTDGKDISVILRTESRTKIMEYTNLVAGKDGIISIPYFLCPGKNTEDITLLYPDQTTEIISITLTRELLLKLTIGSPIVMINQDKKTIETPPYIKNGRTMVPIRIIAETFCCKINYEAKTQKIFIQSQNVEIELQIGKTFITFNGNVQKLDAPPEIRKGRTFLPLRSIIEMFGAKVDWDSKKQEIQISIS